MAFEWMKNLKSPLEALKPFSQDFSSFEAGDPVDWEALGWTVKRTYYLIHKGYLKDPTIEKPSNKSEERQVKVQKKAVKKKKPTSSKKKKKKRVKITKKKKPNTSSKE